MDTGLTTRPTGNPAQTGYVRPEPAPVRDAVPTQLAPSQVVTAATNAASTRNDALNTAAQAVEAREIILDPASREVIYRVIDVRSGQVTRQVPDQALMRLRAYTRALDNGQSLAEAQRQSTVDI